MEKGTIRLKSIANRQDAQHVQDSLNRVWGVLDVTVSLEHKEAFVSYDEKAASLHDFEQALVDSGIAVDAGESMVKD